MAAAGSAAPYTAEPATRVSAPAATTAAAVLALIPPSTSRRQAGLYRSMRARTWRMVSSWCSRKAWPPKPGSTVITSTMSSPSR